MPNKRTMPRVCRVCEAEFFTTPYDVRIGKGLYCSPQCGFEGRRRRALPSIEIEGDTARIPLLARDGSVRAYALIDADDAEWAGQWPWHLSPKGYAVRNVRVEGGYKSFRLHRELLGLIENDGLDGDHINRDRLDYRRSNLRIIPKGGNSQNVPVRPDKRSAYRGVSWHTDTHRWRAYVYVQKKCVRLGSFTDEHEAGRVAKEARLRLMPYATD